MTGLREVATFYDPEEAHVATGFLQASGFTAILADAGMLMQSPMDRIALGGFRVMAPASQAHEAQQLLQSVRSTPNQAAPPCPNCGKADYRRVKSLWFPAAFFFLMGAIVPFAMNSRYLECRNCKTRVTRDITTSVETS